MFEIKIVGASGNVVNKKVDKVKDLSSAIGSLIRSIDPIIFGIGINVILKKGKKEVTVSIPANRFRKMRSVDYLDEFITECLLDQLK